MNASYLRWNLNANEKKKKISVWSILNEKDQFYIIKNSNNSYYIIVGIVYNMQYAVNGRVYFNWCIKYFYKVRVYYFFFFIIILYMN